MCPTAGILRWSTPQFVLKSAIRQKGAIAKREIATAPLSWQKQPWGFSTN